MHRTALVKHAWRTWLHLPDAHGELLSNVPDSYLTLLPDRRGAVTRFPGGFSLYI